ncbi:uncharacterized protein LOC116197000 isoform X2 [Punica granatum]|uniref:Uncharacterized protein LOC116197000 isoform X2 n=1 Tax=Punica granatum TaxID=22663 RepID=A0A6P8CST4_PUNGR|nr:uncharacterized protein LOC116197000 isoform X2 [Punica granatum]
MEATSGVAATRGGSLAMSSPRKEWRAVSEHQSVRKPVDEELGRSNLSQSDERTIYEQGREPLDVDFSSITMDGTSENDYLQQRLHAVARQREDLQQMEIDLRARMIARSEITSIRNSFEAQVKEHADAVVKLQEQLHEKEQIICDLEKKMEEKDRELLAIKRDNEAAWAKEDLLREQKKELATFRRERDHSEAERLQHIKQIHDLQEHLQDKERQLIEMQDQHRVAQETIIYKDEQLREAQAWIARVQEMDALQSHSLQAELRERNEQYNQLWLGWQRQFIEMERFHLHTIQQLQLELAESKERSGSYTSESRVPPVNSKEASQFGQKDGTQLDANGSSRQSVGLSNGNSDNSSIASNGNAGEHVAGLPLASSSLLALPAYVPPGQVTAVHPFVMHHNVPQTHVGHYQTIQPASAIQEWQNAQGVSEGSQLSNHSQLPQTQGDQNPLSSELKYDYQIAANGQTPQREFMDVHIGGDMELNSVNHSVAGERQVLESIEKNHLVSKPEQILQHISSQFRDSLSLHQHQQTDNTKEQGALSLTGYEADSQGVIADQPSSNVDISPPITTVNTETSAMDSTGSALSEPFISGRQTNVMAAAAKTPEPNLLDERSLLACIVRTIPAGGRIRISSTLPNRLGKMLSPLHWHDYKKKYGKLDDFVASHPEYFVIEGDIIQLREGAQEMIAAAAAIAKVAGAAAASAPHSSVLSSVAVTPVAQSYRPKSGSSMDGKDVAPPSVDSNPPTSQLLSAQNQHLNGLYFGSAGGPNVKILSKSKNPTDSNGLGLQSASASIGNGANLSSGGQSKGVSNGRPVPSFAGKPQGRMTGPVSTSRR